MAKFNDLADYQDVLDVFNVVISATALERNVKIEIVGDEKMKEIGKVTIAPPIVKFKHNVDVYITVNQLIFEQLDTEQQILVTEELIGEIVYDSEKDKVTRKKHDYSTFSLLEQKYGQDMVKDTKRLIKDVFAQLNDK